VGVTVLNSRFGFLYGISSEVLNRSPYSFDLQRLGQKLPFIAIDLETRSTPLPMIATGETTTNVLVVGAPTMMAASCHPIKQGRTPPPIGHRHRPGGFLLCVGAYLGLLLAVMPIFAC
jgi:hypothetical protein